MYVQAGNTDFSKFLCRTNCSPFEEAGQCSGFIDAFYITDNTNKIKNSYINSMKAFQNKNHAIPVSHSQMADCYKVGRLVEDILQCMDLSMKRKDALSYWQQYVVAKEIGYQFINRNEHDKASILMDIACNAY